jgi:hypothetical protein
MHVRASRDRWHTLRQFVFVVEEEVVDPDGELVVLDDEEAGGVEDEEDDGAGDIVDDELVVEDVSLGVVDFDEDVEAGGAGGTTTVELELGGVEVVEDGGVCCWQAPSASSTLAATAVIVRRVIDRLLAF